MLGISSSSFYGLLTTEDAIDKIAEMGVGCAEVFLNSFSEYSSEYLDIVSGRLKSGGLAFNSVHTLPTQFEPQLFAITQRQRQDALYFFNKVLEGAAKGGCKTYVMHGKPYHRKNVDKHSVNVESIAERLNELCSIAKDYDMNIALENVHWAMCDNVVFVNEIKDLVPDLRFTLDVKQAMLSNDHWTDYLKSFGDKLNNVHICDVIGNKTALPGRGEFDFLLLSKMLKDYNYSGNVILELYSSDYDDYTDVYQCINYLKNIF